MSDIDARYRQLVRISGIYDLVSTTPFATPWTFNLVVQLLNLISPMPQFLPEHVLFANLMGSIVVVWSLLRVYRPEPLLGLFDGFSRVLFFTWQLYYLILHKITPVVWGFAAFEFLFMVLQLYGYWIHHKVHQNKDSACKVVNHFKEN